MLYLSNDRGFNRIIENFDPWLALGANWRGRGSLQPLYTQPDRPIGVAKIQSDAGKAGQFVLV
jgi:hypothetical protein